MKSQTSMKIINETIDLINDLKETIALLNEESITFTSLYENYSEKNMYDASLLKKRMKEAVIEAVSNE